MTISVEHLLNRECEITPLSDGAWTVDGGFAETADAAVAVWCRLHPVGTAEREELARRELRVTHVVYFMPDVDVERGYTIELQDGFDPTETLEVVEVLIPSIPGTYKRALVNHGQRRP